MISEDFTFPCGAETLAATIDYNAAKDKPTILSLHGGGPSARTRAEYLCKALAARGHSCLRLDFSGSGDSSGVMIQSSLQKRTSEALEAYKLLDQAKPATILATSMGGHVALEMLAHVPVANLFLFCPAAYVDAAFTAPFTEEFTNILRARNDFSAARVFKNLRGFTGNLLYFIGSEDAIIPPEVTQLYEENSLHAAQKDFLVLEGAPHPLHKFLPENPAVLNAVLEMLQNTLDQSTEVAA